MGERGDKVDQPTKWRLPRAILVCSMGDLFHSSIAPGMLNAVHRQMFANPRHLFKQWGDGAACKWRFGRRADRTLDGHEWNEVPRRIK